jgi:hypothetical protein
LRENRDIRKISRKGDTGQQQTDDKNNEGPDFNFAKASIPMTSRKDIFTAPAGEYAAV